MMKMNLQLFGGRGSAGGNAKADATKAAEPKATESNASKKNSKVRNFRQSDVKELEKIIENDGYKKAAQYLKNLTGISFDSEADAEYDGVEQSISAIDWYLREDRGNIVDFINSFR